MKYNMCAKQKLYTVKYKVYFQQYWNHIRMQMTMIK